MKFFNNAKIAWTVAGIVALSSVATSQSVKDLLKVGGVIAVISAFGKDMNNGLNKLWGRTDSTRYKTKVVPILSLGSGTAIGAVQVMGPESQVSKVVAVAQPEVKVIGIRLKALIPIANKNTKGVKDTGGLDIVDQVGVSGIIDIKL